ncbi:carbohydrate ABC transporter permease [Actinopolymorpha singaporensis]|uniref:Carbohydrate ABC transporter membrane protein 1, CUT1 family n=1 Tax=Actinopolymorpha singaporensis TaxID=117157 RepID=A0A1H1WGW4_9ACTN|nr:sugar ABC transporter permease [Actinopolymorpha singaporensis]SDS95861.1 carbohydrate ABC transporter membrane protein 1, CUT1 family [Actinopolymorpha singaporensis]
MVTQTADPREEPATRGRRGLRGSRGIAGMRRSRGPLGTRRREAIDGYLFIAPWLVGFVFLVAGPMLASLVMAFLDWDLFSPPTWAGLGNFRLLLHDRLVAKSLWNTAFFTVISVPLNLVTALGAAMLLNQRVRFRSVFRTLFYLPAVMPAVANAILWFWILNPEVGLANSVLHMVGLPELQWLQDPHTAKPSFILMNLWGIGNTMVIFLAGLQGIPQTLHDAAQVDGANWWHRFWAVTVPMLSPVILFNLVLGIIGSFQIFTSAFLLAGNGGPEQSTLFSVLYLYRLGFEQFRMGYAAAYAWVIFLVILVFSLVQFRLSRSWVHYEGEDAR